MYKKKASHQEPQEAVEKEVAPDIGAEAPQTPETPGEPTPDAGADTAQTPLGKALAEAAQYKDSYLRVTADFQNYKRRAEKEKTDIYKFAGEKVLVDLLPIVDNIERAIAHVSDEEQGGLADGVRMIHKSLLSLLEQHGVEAIAALGEPFDPEMHHAVQMVPSDDHEPHAVIEEYQKGYKLNGKVIRYSMVKVAE